MTRPIVTRRLVALSLSCLLVPGFAAQPVASPLEGVWEADVARSTFKGRAPYRSGRMQVTQVGRDVHVICDVVTANGTPFHFEYRGPEDGTVLPVTGNPYYDSAAIHRIDAARTQRIERRAGKDIGVTQFELAPDGASFLARSGRSTPEDGHLYESVILWKRVTAASPTKGSLSK